MQPIEKWGGGSAGCSGLDRNRAGAPKGYAIELAQYHLEPFPHCQRQARQIIVDKKVCDELSMTLPKEV